MSLYKILSSHTKSTIHIYKLVLVYNSRIMVQSYECVGQICLWHCSRQYNFLFNVDEEKNSSCSYCSSYTSSSMLQLANTSKESCLHQNIKQ